MKVYLWKVKFYLSNEYDDEEYLTKIVAPDMTLEEAKRYFTIWSLKEWPETTIKVEIRHLQKEYLLGIV